MSVLTVTTVADAVANDGELSLREAVAQANSMPGADTIQFASGLEGKTLVLTRGELVLRRDVTIDGDQNDDGVAVTLSGGDTQRILSTSGGGTDVTLNDLTLTHGYANGNGGAVLAEGRKLLLDGCVVTKSELYGHAGGGIYVSTGQLFVISSKISENKTVLYDNGGGIASNGDIFISNSTLADNESYKGGAIAMVHGGNGTLRMSNSAIVNNHAGSEGGGIWAYESSVFFKRCLIDASGYPLHSPSCD